MASAPKNRKDDQLIIVGFIALMLVLSCATTPSLLLASTMDGQIFKTLLAIHLAGIAIFIGLGWEYRQRSQSLHEGATLDYPWLFQRLCHDIATPMSTAMGYFEVLLEQTKNPQMKIVGTSLDNAARMLESALYYEASWKYHPKHPLPLVDLKQSIEEITSTLAPLIKEKSLSFTIKNQASQQCTLRAAPDIFTRHILRNPIANAIHFSPPGKPITLLITESATTIKFIIQDSGIGIPQATLAKILTQQAKSTRTGTSGERGAGLALQSIQNFMTKMKGSLEIRSNTDEGGEGEVGTTVTLAFPKYLSETKKAA